jgi:hypothetical protein
MGLGKKTQQIDSDALLRKHKGRITYFLFEINAAMDGGRKLDFKEARDAAASGELTTVLREKLGKDIDLSIIDGEFETAFNEKMQGIADILWNRERRKTGVENEGMCLLIAYATELIQEVNHDESR